MEKKKDIISLITAALFLLLLTVPTILYVTVGENTDEVLEEKRTLAELPAEFHNDYFRDLETWYNDHTPYRMTLITFLLEQSQKYSAFYRNEIRPVLSALFTPAWYNEAYKEWTGLDQPYLVPMEDYLVTYGREDWLYYTGENSVGFFTGNNLLAPEVMEQWKDAFLALTELCREKGIRLVYMVPANKEQIYPEYMASYHIENLPKREEIIYRK